MRRGMMLIVSIGLMAMSAAADKAATQNTTSTKPAVTRVSNDTVDLTPKTEFEGRKLTFDFPGLEIGVAEYEEGPTGCTVFYFPRQAMVAADISRGSQCTIYSDYLENGKSDVLDAICLAGGSIYGLEAATGVTAELLAKDDYTRTIRKTTGAIIYDLWRNNMIYPDKRLGRAALAAARPGVFLLGPHGVGRNTGCGALGGEPTGQGGAFRQVGKTRIAAFTVVNTYGAILDRQRNVVRGNLDSTTGLRLHNYDFVNDRLAKMEQPASPEKAGNCILTVVVTNTKVNDLHALARQVHASLGRAIEPFHTPGDGDVVYAVTTQEIDGHDLNTKDLGIVASELAWDAVLSCF